MKQLIAYDESTGVTSVSYTEHISLSDVVEGAYNAAQFAMSHHSIKILIDIRNVETSFGLQEMYKLPRALAERMQKGGINILLYKRALVIPKREGFQFFIETVSNNVGQNVRVFFDENNARDWLVN